MIDILLSRLQKVRPAGNNRWTACCPAHDDKTPSLTVTQARDKVLIHCFSGCLPDEVIAATGLSWDDMFEDEFQAANQRAVSSRKNLPPVDPLLVDENILLIAREALSKGDSLSVEDQARAELAYERVKGARNA